MANFTKWDTSLNGTLWAGPIGVPFSEGLLYCNLHLMTFSSKGNIYDIEMQTYHIGLFATQRSDIFLVDPTFSQERANICKVILCVLVIKVVVPPYDPKMV